MSRRRHWPWLVSLFLLSWLVTAVVTLPLAAITDRIELPKEMTLEAVGGNIWAGHATLFWQGKPPIHMNAWFQPKSLFELAAEWQITARTTGGSLDARIRPSWPGERGPRVSSPRLHAHIDAASPWMEDRLPFATGGTLEIHGEHLRLTPYPREGQLDLAWSDARLDTARAIRGGDIRAEVRFRDGEIAGEIHSANNDAADLPKVAFDLSGSVDDSIRLDGHVDPGDNSALARQLRLFGEPSADGRIALSHEFFPSR